MKKIILTIIFLFVQFSFAQDFKIKPRIESLDSSNALKANSADVYTKTEMDVKISQLKTELDSLKLVVFNSANDHTRNNDNPAKT